MKCIVCGGKLHLLKSLSGRKIYQCQDCGLGMTGDSAPLDYSNYHRDEVYTSHEPQFLNIFERFLKSIERYRKSGKILDVGSSTGLLLSLFKKRGWGVQGVEPSKKAARHANDRGIPTIESSFETAHLDKGKFDVVIFDHVLEHMQDPKRVIRKAKELLREKGIIMINVPNFGSMSARSKGADWEYVLPGEHVWHFTPQSLFLLLKKEGFSTLEWEARSGIWGYAHPGKELWLALTTGKKRFITEFFTIIPTWFVTRMKQGTGISIIAQKT